MNKKIISLEFFLALRIFVNTHPGLVAPGERSPYNCSIHFEVSLASSWRYVFIVVPQESAGTFHLVVNFSSICFQSAGVVGKVKYSFNWPC